jgi:hypothetical protein
VDGHLLIDWAEKDTPTEFKFPKLSVSVALAGQAITQVMAESADAPTSFRLMFGGIYAAAGANAVREQYVESKKERQKKHEEILKSPDNLLERASDMDHAMAIRSEDLKVGADIVQELPAELDAGLELTMETASILQAMSDFGVQSVTEDAKDLQGQFETRRRELAQAELHIRGFHDLIEENPGLTEHCSPLLKEFQERRQTSLGNIKQLESKLKDARRGTARIEFNPSHAVRDMIAKSSNPDKFIADSLDPLLELHFLQKDPEDSSPQPYDNAAALRHILQIGVHWIAVENSEHHPEQ